MLNRALGGLRATNLTQTTGFVAKRLLTSTRYLKGESRTPYEDKIYRQLAKELEPKSLVVKDISYGDGAMFAISIESGKFNGLSTVKQHRLVNRILKDEISKWHGLQLKTKKTV
ncbi:hypothetical protein HII13_003987 [Brettanomyces bruxellensis]|uniref:DEBR0S1_20032g1_1 n=1 Tax=Dekkera bruxellensis TaxID=5007 RepID=A0A3F2Y0Q0_DEKBR|nr:hypothetical protein HII12_004785 [Brettanomyces bruxellensis]KAF6008203.1 hypothetical protein HII13_003987 [Brettanomyces bruxellensis]VUG16568.1 BOL3 [Brettanomyces bruxellensis]